MTEQEARDRIFLTVDFTELTLAPHLMRLASELHGLKIDSHQEIPLRKLVSMAKNRGVKNVYVDAKSSDGPDQMPLTIEKAHRQHADFLSIEMSAGASAVSAAVKSNHNGLRLVGTTIPSDMPTEDCIEIYGQDPKKVVSRMASIAVREGLEYITCSAHEILAVRETKPARRLSIIATGIRMQGEERNDQIRIATPGEAIKLGADWLAIGRSITESDDPEQAIAHIVEDMLLASKV